MSPEAPTSEPALDALLSAPDEHTISALAALQGDVLVLGAGGKMGPTVACMARRAIADTTRRVIAVSRFSNPATEGALQAHGVHTIRADLADPAAVAALPLAPTVLWMAGQKFGSTGDPVSTWTQNVVASALAAQRYAGSRIVCFSTGNVYGRQPVDHGGAREEDALVPDGEYAASCIGRERVFTSIAQRTHSPLLVYRLFYACDLRYGVVTDIARQVLHGIPVPLDTAFVNVIWQGDANRLALRALGAAAVPTGAHGAVALNVTGSIVAVRDLAERIGTIAGITPVFSGTPRKDALIANTARLTELLPHTPVPLDTLCAWAVQWLRGNGRVLSAPTKFEVRDGRY
jgi:nucleoside-diphosphate-sugar epimerase